MSSTISSTAAVPPGARAFAPRPPARGSRGTAAGLARASGTALKHGLRAPRRHDQTNPRSLGNTTS